MTYTKLKPWGAAVLLLFSCNNPNSETTDLTNYPSDGIIRVHAENSSFTRGGYETANLNSFRLFVTNPASASHTYENIRMQKENGEFVAYKEDGTPLTMKWQNGFAQVDVVATTGNMKKLDKPFNVSVKADQTENSAIEESDFLYYRKNGLIPDSDLVNAKIQLLLTHGCAKFRLTLNLSNVSSSTTNPVKNVLIEGIKLERDFNPATAQWEGSATTTTSSIIPNAVSYSASSAIATFDCILVPQKTPLNSLAINFTVEGTNHKYIVPQEIMFEGNTMYNLSITVEK